jgi:hypothetical protein
MEIIKLGNTHTHPVGTSLKVYEDQVFSRVENYARYRYPGANLLIIQANNHFFWIQQQAELIRTALNSPDWQVFFITIVDPCEIEQLFKALDLTETDYTYTEMGYTALENKAFFDSFAIIAKDKFQQYSDEQVSQMTPEKLFISYSRKPRMHRMMLTKKLIEQDLAGYGVVTLGVDPADPQWGRYSRNIAETPEQYRDTGGLDVLDASNFNNIPHDLWSLGDLDLWQRHFLHIINESQFYDLEPSHHSVDSNNTRRMFISEKLFKPLIGHRPFLLNTNPVIYNYLESQGFHTFRNYWPVDVTDVTAQRMASQTTDKICEIIKWLTGLEKSAIVALYEQMQPELQHNRSRFFQYAREQQEKFYTCTEVPR